MLLGKLKVYIIMAVAFMTFASIAYAYYKDTQERLQQYAENTAKLEIAVTTQKQATESLQGDIVMMSNSLRKLNRDFDLSRKEVATLQQTFSETASGSERDIGKTASRKPALVEQAVNNGTEEVLDCIEILSGNIGDHSEQDIANCTGTTILNGL